MIQRKNLLTLLTFLLFSIDPVAASWFSFNFSNLLYSVGICAHVGPFCPAPTCRGPGSNAAVCDFYACSDDNDNDCTFAATESMCNDNTDCMASAAYYDGVDEEYFADEGNSETIYSDTDGDGDSDAEYQYQEATANNTDADAERGYISGGSDGFTHNASSVNTNYMPYYVIGGILTVALMAIVWRKRNYEVDNEDLSEELGAGVNLHGAVAKHLGSLEAGEIHPVKKASTQTSFVLAGSTESSASDYVMA